MNYTSPSGSFYSPSIPLFIAVAYRDSSNWMNYTDPSGSFYSPSTPLYNAAIIRANQRNTLALVQVSGGAGPGTTCSASYTYYQRVYDNINTFWCYYSGSSLNESPGMTDTTPNNSGDISGYSIVYVTDQIVCS